MATRVRGQGAPLLLPLPLVSITFPSLCDTSQGHLALKPGMVTRGPLPTGQVPTDILGKHL